MDCWGRRPGMAVALTMGGVAVIINGLIQRYGESELRSNLNSYCRLNYWWYEVIYKSFLSFNCSCRNFVAKHTAVRCGKVRWNSSVRHCVHLHCWAVPDNRKKCHPGNCFHVLAVRRNSCTFRYYSGQSWFSTITSLSWNWRVCCLTLAIYMLVDEVNLQNVAMRSWSMIYDWIFSENFENISQ